MKFNLDFKKTSSYLMFLLILISLPNQTVCLAEAPHEASKYTEYDPYEQGNKSIEADYRNIQHSKEKQAYRRESYTVKDKKAPPLKSVWREQLGKPNKLAIGKFYGGASLGLSSFAALNASGSVVSGGGIMSNPSAAVSLDLGYRFFVAKYFDIGIEGFGRWAFNNTSFDVVQLEYTVKGNQFAGGNIKIMFTTANRRFSMFGLIGFGAMLGSAEYLSNTVSNSASITSFAISYGIGGEFMATKNLAVFLRFMGITDLNKTKEISPGAERFSFESYSFEVGINIYG